MSLHDFIELSNFTKENFTKAYGKSFFENTNFIEDFERTKYFHYLENINKTDSERDEALDNYFSSLENSDNADSNEDFNILDF